jgi:hypothetical protein
MISMHSVLRLLHVAIAVFLAFFAMPAPAQDDDTIDWFDNYDKALQEAKRTRKPIFLEFRCEA